jgi:hypothetical protein
VHILSQHISLIPASYDAPDSLQLSSILSGPTTYIRNNYRPHAVHQELFERLALHLKATCPPTTRRGIERHDEADLLRHGLRVDRELAPRRGSISGVKPWPPPWHPYFWVSDIDSLVTCHDTSAHAVNESLARSHRLSDNLASARSQMWHYTSLCCLGGM